MRIIARPCADPRDHGIHVSDAQRSMYSTEDDDVRYLCGGDRSGYRRIGDAETLADLVAELDAERDPIGTAYLNVFGIALDATPRRTGPDPSLDVSEPYRDED